MRTTISIDDNLLKADKRRARCLVSLWGNSSRAPFGVSSRARGAPKNAPRSPCSTVDPCSGRGSMPAPRRRCWRPSTGTSPSTGYGDPARRTAPRPHRGRRRAARPQPWRSNHGSRARDADGRPVRREEDLRAAPGPLRTALRRLRCLGGSRSGRLSGGDRNGAGRRRGLPQPRLRPLRGPGLDRPPGGRVERASDARGGPGA